jgi:hypothetical protein
MRNLRRSEVNAKNEPLAIFFPNHLRIFTELA